MGIYARYVRTGSENINIMYVYKMNKKRDVCGEKTMQNAKQRGGIQMRKNKRLSGIIAGTIALSMVVAGGIGGVTIRA